MLTSLHLPWHAPAWVAALLVAGYILGKIITFIFMYTCGRRLWLWWRKRRAARSAAAAGGVEDPARPLLGGEEGSGQGLLRRRDQDGNDEEAATLAGDAEAGASELGPSAANEGVTGAGAPRLEPAGLEQEGASAGGGGGGAAPGERLPDDAV